MSIELAVAIFAGCVVPVVLWWTGRLQNRVAKTEDDLSKFMIRAAEIYITKNDLKLFKEDIHERLDRLEGKIDNLIKVNGLHR